MLSTDAPEGVPLPAKWIEIVHPDMPNAEPATVPEKALATYEARGWKQKRASKTRKQAKEQTE